MTAIPAVDCEFADRVFRARCEARAILYELGELTLDQAVVVFPAEEKSWWATFRAACRKADARQRQSPEDPAILRARRLLADDGISLERAWHELNSTPGRAANSTVEALMLGLRERGVGALREPHVRRRLAELDDAQALKVAERLQKLKPKIARAWQADQIEALMQLRETLR
jgi:hypothetical protein